jgi:alkanesulfonate monooxygenase SsuD/methylene tetrahydromethanopterin reductase-like flavin-dependent oxidoreductase (luciferase family)
VVFDIELNSVAHYPADELMELAPRVEDAGFDCFWKGESNSTDPLVALTGIAARTKTLKVGTAIYHIYGRSPITMGIQAATLQDLSHGRMILGLGVANKTIAEWHGGVFDRPLRRIREYTEIVRKAAAGERVEYAGEIYSTGKRFQLSWKPRYPEFPIYLAGLGPKMTHLVGEIGDGVVINMGIPAKVKEIAQRVRQGASDSGRDPNKVEIMAKVRVCVHRDRAVARQKLRQVLTFYNIADHYSKMLRECGFEKEVEAIAAAFKANGFKAAQAALSDEYMDKLPVIPATSVEEVRERLQPFVESGVTRLSVPYVPASEPNAEDARRFIQGWQRTAK